MEENIKKEIGGAVAEQPAPPAAPVQPQVIERIIYKEKKNAVWGFWVIIVLFAVAFCGALYWGIERNGDADYYRYLYNNLVFEQDSLVSALNENMAEEQEFIDKYPVIVTNVKIANVNKNLDIINDFGSTIYAYETNYLQPKIKLTSRSNKSITLYTKWYYPSGELITGTSSPSGFSQKESVYISTGENTLELAGWGGDDDGYYSAGNYRLEIWLNDICIASRDFTIY